MATPSPTENEEIPTLGRKVIITTWAMGDADTGIGERRTVAYSDRTIAASGTFGGSVNVAIQGSLDSTNGVDGNWFTLTDPQGNNLSGKTAAFLEAISELVLWIRPVTSGGTSSAITITLLGKNN